MTPDFFIGYSLCRCSSRALIAWMYNLWLTHWGRVTHICVSKLTIVGSDNGLSPDRRQAIIWANAGVLLIEPLGTKFREIFIEINIFSARKMHLKISSGKWPFCLGLNVLTRPESFQIIDRTYKILILNYGDNFRMVVFMESSTRMHAYFPNKCNLSIITIISIYVVFIG